ncbi:MAG: SURF1 family protein [Rhodospirillaceae bacterium]
MAADERRLRWVPLIAALIAAALGTALGTWQVSRGHEKRDLQERYEKLSRDAPVTVSDAPVRASDVELRRVFAHGTFEPRYAVYLDNRVMHGVPGYYVIMPLKVSAQRYVLVNRGWIAGLPDRSRLPQVRTPAGPVDVTGIATVPAKRPFELSSQVIEGRVWQNLTVERYRQAYAVPIQPFVIRQENALDDGLKREWEPPDFGIERHYGYAVQWYLLAITALAFYGITHVRRRRKNGQEEQA